MKAVKDISELNSALVSNFRLKAKILSILFGTVLFLQLCAMLAVIVSTDLVGTVIPVKMLVVGPSLLAVVFISELFAFRYLKRMTGSGGQLKNSFIYLSTLVEISFPCIIMLLASNFLRDASLFPPMQIINSPLLMILFIMIVLSALLLDARLSFFAGCVACVEYLAINVSILRQEPIVGPVDYPNAIIKSILLAVAGLVTGFVSKKIREAVISSLHSKNELIHNLDKRVAEKTVELEKKNILLEEKQKEILDSIHYAKRIQYTLLPNEKYLVKVLEKLRKK